MLAEIKLWVKLRAEEYIHGPERIIATTLNNIASAHWNSHITIHKGVEPLKTSIVIYVADPMQHCSLIYCISHPPIGPRKASIAIYVANLRKLRLSIAITLQTRCRYRCGCNVFEVHPLAFRSIVFHIFLRISKIVLREV